MAEATGGDFRTGALAAGANEALVTHLNTLVKGNEDLLSMSSQIVGVLAAAAQEDTDASKMGKGGWIAKNATQYNFLGDHGYGQAAASLAEYMQREGATAEEITQAQRDLAQGQGFDGVQPANEFIKAWGEFVAGELVGLGLLSFIGKLGSWVGKGSLNTSLLDELTANGVKFTPENVIATTRDSSGKVIFLEAGNSKAGLQHIIEEHGTQFAQMGVSEAQIPEIVMRAVSEGKLVGYQGSGAGRPIYELSINGQTQRIAVTVGDNGFVVGANPRGSIK